MLKQIPEDFVVQEIPLNEADKTGDFLVFQVKKKGRNSEDIAAEISSALDIQRKYVGYAGNKDKNAVTSQFMSICLKAKVENVLQRLKRVRDCEFTFIGRSVKPISLGDLKGNHFRIVVRNLEKDLKTDWPVPNYYDEQRFSQDNVEAGRAIIKRDFDKAAKLITGHASTVYSSTMLGRLEQNDAVGALRCIPKKILKLYVHSYQSYLFNEAVSRYLKFYGCDEVKYSLGLLRFPRQEVDDIEVPLVGFGMPEAVNIRLKRIIDELVKREGITPRDFVIAQIPELSCEGTARRLLAEVHDLSVGRPEQDDLNPGKKKVVLDFWLEPGCYATIVVKAVTSHS